MQVLFYKEKFWFTDADNNVVELSKEEKLQFILFGPESMNIKVTKNSEFTLIKTVSVNNKSQFSNLYPEISDYDKIEIIH